MKAALWLMAIPLTMALGSSYAKADAADDFLNGEAMEQAAVSDPATDVEPGFQATAKTKKQKQVSEANTQPEPNFEKMGDQASVLKLEEEALEAEEFAYDDFAKQTAQEANKLRGEVIALERKVQGSQNAAERAKNNAELAHKRLELQQKMQQEAKVKLAQAEKLKRLEERRLKTLQARTQVVVERATSAKQKTKEISSSVNATQRENAQLERRLKKALAQIEREKLRRKQIREKQARVMEKQRKLRAEVKRAEKRMAQFEQAD